MLGNPGSRQPLPQAASGLVSPLRSIISDAKAFATCLHGRTTLVVSGADSTGLYLCCECGSWRMDGDPDWRVPLLARRLRQLIEQFEAGDDDL
jgi:hypothetical protein